MPGQSAQPPDDAAGVDRGRRRHLLAADADRSGLVAPGQPAGQEGPVLPEPHRRPGALVEPSLRRGAAAVPAPAHPAGHPVARRRARRGAGTARGIALHHPRSPPPRRPREGWEVPGCLHLEDQIGAHPVERNHPQRLALDHPQQPGAARSEEDRDDLLGVRQDAVEARVKLRVGLTPIGRRRGRSRQPRQPHLGSSAHATPRQGRQTRGRPPAAPLRRPYDPRARSSPATRAERGDPAHRAARDRPDREVAGTGEEQQHRQPDRVERRLQGVVEPLVGDRVVSRAPASWGATIHGSRSRRGSTSGVDLRGVAFGPRPLPEGEHPTLADRAAPASAARLERHVRVHGAERHRRRA